jgi:hypothetical protein
MTDENRLLNEQLVTLAEAAKDFAGVAVPASTVKRYVYYGVNGVKLETVQVNKRYTSKEAIQRFIERKPYQFRYDPPVVTPKKDGLRSSKEVFGGMDNRNLSRKQEGTPLKCRGKTKA